VCYTFVDDSHVVHSSTKADMDTRTGLVNKEMQQVVDTWEGGVRASGGVLVLSKSYWFLIHFVFERNKWRYARINKCPILVTIRDITGQDRIELERLDVHDAKETPGMLKAMDGNQKAQTNNLWSKANQWADKIRAGTYTRAETWYSLQFCLLKAIEYPLMATSMSKEQCTTIMKLIRAAGLLSLEINRHLSKVVVPWTTTIPRGRYARHLDRAGYIEHMDGHLVPQRHTYHHWQPTQSIHGTTHSGNRTPRTPTSTSIQSIRTSSDEQLDSSPLGIM
jgi:hypothetical protein